MKALELLDLKLLEPAMGAAAFHNELINQLAEAYLNYRQKEKKEKISMVLLLLRFQNGLITLWVDIIYIFLIIRESI